MPCSTMYRITLYYLKTIPSIHSVNTIHIIHIIHIVHIVHIIVITTVIIINFNTILFLIAENIENRAGN